MSLTPKQKTYSAKPSEIERKWYIIDASEAPMGRVATRVATLLTGKEKAMFTQHIDCGDHVVVINAEKLIVTGKKLDQKMYYHHSHFPGGLKESTLKEKMDTDPTHALQHAIRGMLPVNKLRDGRLARLRVFANAEHSHTAQQPQAISLKMAIKTKGTQ